MNHSDYSTESRHSIVNMDPLDRWASALIGLGLAGSAMRRPNARLRTAIGVELLRRGLTGHCYAYQAFGVRTKSLDRTSSVSVPYELGVRARASITISKPRADVYRFWRDFENLPKIMKHLVSVTPTSDNQSHWVAEGPRGKQVEWDAEIHNDIENELIAWRSLPGADVDSAGSVHFRDAAGGRGTEVVVRMQYNPPAGFVGATVAKLFWAVTRKPRSSRISSA